MAALVHHVAERAEDRLAGLRQEWNGMACVLTAAVVNDNRAVVGHVGDTRLYKVTARDRTQLQKITRDHSPVGELEDRGEITEAEAMAHPQRNEVFRDVGSQEFGIDDLDFIDITEIKLDPDSALLMCSDGLTDALTKAEITRIVDDNIGSPNSASSARTTAWSGIRIPIVLRLPC